MTSHDRDALLLDDDAYQTPTASSSATSAPMSHRRASRKRSVSPSRAAPLTPIVYSTDITRITDKAGFLNAIKSTQDQESILAGCLALISAPLLFGLYCCGSFNVVINQDEIGLVTRNGAPILLEPGRHFLPSPITHFEQAVKINQDLIKFESITILNLRANQRAYLLDNGEYRLLDQPGRYFWNSSLCQHLGTYNLNEKVITAGASGPLRRIIVNPGEVAVIFEQGHLKTLEAGIHEITDSTAQYSAHMPITQVTHILKPITTMSADGLNLTAEAAVFFSISDPAKLIVAVGQRQFNDLVDQRARIALAEAIRGCHLREIGTKPRGAGASTSDMLTDMQDQPDTQMQSVDYGRISQEIHQNFMGQLQEKMLTVGIHIDLVQLLTLTPEDALHQLLAQQATANAAAEAAITQAKAAARASRLTAKAHADNRLTEARGEADAIEALATANASRITKEGEASAAATRAQVEALGDPRTAAAVLMTRATASAMGQANTAIVSPGTFFGLPKLMDDMLSGQAPRAVQPAV